MLNRTYSPWHIMNSGEKECDKQLSMAENMDEAFYAMHSLRLSSRFHRTQMAGEIDFLVITKLGIMVVEVKGGIIGFGTQDKGGTGYYRIVGENEKEDLCNPFIQVDGNADAIKKYFQTKEIRNIFVGSMVCFPECEFHRDGISEDVLWHRGALKTLPHMILESLEIQREDFKKKQISKGINLPIQWSEIEEADMDRFTKILEPEFDPSKYRKILKINLEENERRREQGLTILKGLEENPRLIIQGPPGSGKTVFALYLIDRLCRKEGKKGIYICWNELLLEEMGHRLSEQFLDISEDQLHRSLYFHLITQFAENTGDDSLKPSYEVVEKGELRQLVKAIISKKGNKKLPKYDFAIIDEAQDLFDKGLDILMKAILKDNNPIQKGAYLILYDDSQDYPSNGQEMELYVRTRDAFKTYASSYTLSESLRSAAGHGIQELIIDAMQGKFDPARNYGTDVSIAEWKNPETLINLLKQTVKQEMLRSKLTEEEILVLFSADLFKDKDVLDLLADESRSFEFLVPENYDKTKGKICYTTMLKAKGLERSFTVLVCNGNDDPKELYQLFIGASRAKGKIQIFMKEKD